MHLEVPLFLVPFSSFANEASQQPPETQILDYQPEVIAGLDLHQGLLLVWCETAFGTTTILIEMNVVAPAIVAMLEKGLFLPDLEEDILRPARKAFLRKALGHRTAVFEVETAIQRLSLSRRAW